MTPITLVKDYRNMSERTTNACNIVPCGKCVLCLKRRSSSWAFRLSEEKKISMSSCFLTLTYENTPLSYNGNPTLEKRDYQKFMKKLRKKVGSATALKYYTCGEYGTENKRPHFHSIMFNLPKIYLEDSEYLTDIWNHGHVDIAKAELGSIRYVTNYVMKGKWKPEGELDDRNPEISLMSKKMGLEYINPEMEKFHKERLESYITLPGGVKQTMPRYFRDKIFTKEEKAIMNIAAEEARELNFEKLFNNSTYLELIWKKNQIRIQEKLERTERLTV